MFLARLLQAATFAASFAIADAAAVEWHLPTAYPEANYHTKNLQEFAKEVAEKSGGKLTITIHPGESLFKHTEIKRAVQLGQAQAGELLLSTLANEEPYFAADTIPFLATSIEESRKLWDLSRETVSDKFGAQNLIVLYSPPWPSQGLYANSELNTVADMAGLKFRVQSPVFARFAELAKVQPITIAYADLIMGLSTNVVDSMMSSATAGPDLKIWEHIRYFYDVEASRPRQVVIVNAAAFNALEPEVQQIVRDAAAAAQERGWERVVALEQEFLDQLRQNGMTVLKGSPELMEGLKEIGAVMISEWAEQAGPEGKELVDKLQAGN